MIFFELLSQMLSNLKKKLKSEDSTTTTAKSNSTSSSNNDEEQDIGERLPWKETPKLMPQKTITGKLTITEKQLSQTNEMFNSMANHIKHMEKQNNDLRTQNRRLLKQLDESYSFDENLAKDLALNGGYTLSEEAIGILFNYLRSTDAYERQLVKIKEKIERQKAIDNEISCGYTPSKPSHKLER